MKTCPSCGIEIRDEARFCRSCGYRYEAAPAATSAAVAQADPAVPAASERAGTHAAARSDQVACPVCGTVYPVGTKFCRKDGTSLFATRSTAAGPEPAALPQSSVPLAAAPATPTQAGIVCPQCGALNAPTARFCKGDGYPLGAQAVAPAEVRRADERPHQSPAEVKPGGDRAVGTRPAHTEASRTVPPSPPVAASAKPSLAPTRAAASAQREQIAGAPTGRIRSWKVPVIAAGSVAVLSVAGWFGYSKFYQPRTAGTQTAAATAKTQAESKAPAQPTPQMPTVQPPAPAPAQAVPTPPAAASTAAVSPAPASPPAQAAQVVPPVPMSRDAASGCFIWKPDLVSNDEVKWVGGCKDGLADGPGNAQWFRDAKLSVGYQGTFRAGKLQGKGVMLAAGGDRYEGEYVDGMREGRGIYTSATGERYDGQWRENKRDGLGVLVLADGRRYDGPFRDGKPLGNLTVPAAAQAPQAVAPRLVPVPQAQGVPPPKPAPSPPVESRVAVAPPPPLAPPPAARVEPPAQVATVPVAPPPPRVDPAQFEATLNQILRANQVNGVSAKVGDDMVVTLRGSTNAGDKQKALAIARNSSGAKSVRNQIFVVE